MTEKINTDVILAVVEQGSFKDAADLLGYTQAGISYIINTAEQVLGFRLFYREHSGIRLTSEGEALLPYLYNIKNDERRMQNKISDLNGLNAGHIKVLVFDSVFVNWIPKILKEFKAIYPNVTLEFISEEDCKKAELMLLHHDVDCAFFLHHVKNKDIHTRFLLEESLKAVVSPDHPMAANGSFSVNELGSYPYIRMAFHEDTGIDEIFATYDTVPNTVYTIDNDYAAIAMAAENHGFCIFPELLLANAPSNVVCLDFDRPVHRTISIGTVDPKECSAIVTAFTEFVVSWVKKSIS
ncbi:MAG: LysR family transcriptional regulator [Eubacteriales bacterium]|nr:LysR family transcriptional regulator [Eubacteriales bacterium]